MFRHPFNLAERSAMSTFSFGMLVQVRCMQVSMPMSDWQVRTSSDDRSEVRPPAFLKIIMKFRTTCHG